MKMQSRALLHICCAPDATVPWKDLLDSGMETVGYFYGSNIQPENEYKKRLNAVIQLSEFFGAPVLIDSYDPLSWLINLKGNLYFPAQIEKAAQIAKDKGFTYLGTTLTISPHKKPGLINGIGKSVARRYGLHWIDVIWRKNNGFLRSIQMSKKLGLYRQNYCGCILSIRGEKNGAQ